MPCEPVHLLYEYAVLRFVPDVVRGEFINIGLVMMCKRRKWIRIAINIDDNRIKALNCDTSIDTLKHQLDTFVAIAEGDKIAGCIAELPVEERFRWITAVKSAVIQTSCVHPGLCENLEDTFSHILHEMVL